MKCMNCGSTNDVIDFVARKEKLFLCVNCRGKLANGQLGKIGRPSLGVTKKVSLTLSEEGWKRLDELAKGNRSQYLRHLVLEAQSEDWSNDACLGYAMLGMENMGYSERQIQELLRAIKSEFDWKSVEEAKCAYKDSSY
ncbi:hypothetical protein [Pontibacillus litoralis]|uniref:Uncharacterized protein n=1 Tax=Pontibacillus litoralis JSM 072002 TaxID=1385512 RepID=A0A0A5G291_9BACI|nr:hypothetical protein [Pontibacillus litoralis]KGX85200.1 hypothetical protein N784_09900 [Pontibacillus litoralis JSM 072002]